VIGRRDLLAAGLLGAVALLPRRGRGAGLDRPGRVVVLRHAIAPGTGDPPGFVLGDCSTQRNLDERGRAQARAIGEMLRAEGLGDAAVHSSRWCRCLETARLLALGPVQPLPSLDSLFAARHRRDAQTLALRRFLAEAGAAGPPLVLVTHQVNISALTGRPTRSGEAVVLQRQSEGGLEVLASLPPPTG
jgi:broad specificity phosphatase PhoE